MMVSVTAALARDAIVGPSPTALWVTTRLALSGLCLWLLVVRRLNASWLMLAGALAGISTAGLR